MIVVESIPQGVVHHGIHQGGVAHAVAVTALHHGIGGQGHAFHAAGDNDIGVARFDHLGGHVDAVQTGTADNINGNGGGGHGQTGLQGSLTGDVLAQAGLNDAAHINMIDLLGGDACAGKGFFDDDGTQLRSRDSAERAAHGADGGTAGACQYDFLHSSCLLKNSKMGIDNESYFMIA